MRTPRKSFRASGIGGPARIDFSVVHTARRARSISGPYSAQGALHFRAAEHRIMGCKNAKFATCNKYGKKWGGRACETIKNHGREKIVKKGCARSHPHGPGTTPKDEGGVIARHSQTRRNRDVLDPIPTEL